jgi:hypothetical protein
VTRSRVKLSSRFARMGAAMVAGLIGAYVTARLDVAIEGLASQARMVPLPVFHRTQTGFLQSVSGSWLRPSLG